MKYNIYCDESCHLEKDKQRYMILGAIACEKSQRNRIRKDILDIKQKHGVGNYVEIKWNKVSNSKLDYYKELIDYFFENDNLYFRSLIADKTKLNHKKYMQTHDDWYYKMYYQLLVNVVRPKVENYIYLDKKDSKSARKVATLKEYLGLKLADNDFEQLKNVQNIDSKESVIIQLVDLFIGAIGYINNGRYKEENASTAKSELMLYISKKSKYSLTKSTVLSEKKFNLFFINLQGEQNGRM